MRFSQLLQAICSRVAAFKPPGNGVGLGLITIHLHLAPAVEDLTPRFLLCSLKIVIKILDSYHLSRSISDLFS
jgi:hypothetical protein